MEIACRVLGVVSSSDLERGFDNETALHATRLVNLPQHQKALGWKVKGKKTLKGTPTPELHTAREKSKCAPGGSNAGVVRAVL